MDSICGGVISESQRRKMMKKHGVWATMMAYVMPDDKYKKYIAFKKRGENKKATILFDKYARSQI